MHPATPPSAPPPLPSHGPPRRVLVVEDDPTVAEVVTGYLSRAGYTTAHAADGVAALDRAADFRPHLVVLDLMLPGIDGLEVCRRLRRGDGPAVPVVMLTARGEEADRILGLELGADDYVTKPFSPRELVLRIGSVLRRAESAPPAAEPAAVLRAGDLTADPGGRRADRAGRALSLTAREFDLLVFLMRHPGRVFSREELLHRVWGWEFGDLSTVTVHVRRLREKIEADPAAPRLVTTVWGAGYRFDAVGDEPPPEDGPLRGDGPLS
ncbi:response regulator transcription factor [Streptomyces nigrescens]|uniref:DNA-binding response regulator n=1 Tax=Streptomyces nigrescens TaxID=1920 RepID=A0A640TUH2_STRNI|nr:response regulator transcription factor [Streptomyces libani]WAT99926.1 response regulator transcription factor [Streptomyces libani subsp. libani]GFE25871.1 DNA-binding response regulator [Streptomyces libani subsp. libani]GGW03512.1 DNA-binding response regulator [Streptomyces libani subsp. libani]